MWRYPPGGHASGPQQTRMPEYPYEFRGSGPQQTRMAEYPYDFRGSGTQPTRMAEYPSDFRGIGSQSIAKFEYPSGLRESGSQRMGNFECPFDFWVSGPHQMGMVECPPDVRVLGSQQMRRMHWQSRPSVPESRNMHHQNRLTTISFWFSQMNEALQTAALVGLFRRTTPKIAKFISIILETTLRDNEELELCEKDANNATTVGNLRFDQEEVAIAKLLANLPLLHPYNTEAKQEYVKISKSLLRHSITTGACLDEARQLMAFIVLHPAMRPEKKSFETFNKALTERVQRDYIIRTATQQLPVVKVRSNSLTPPYSSPSESLISQDDIYMKKTRSSSMSLYGPLSPQSSGTPSSGSGSESHLENLHLSPNAIAHDPVLRNDVEAWLKYLRLHKYTAVFNSMSYEQLISINDFNFEEILDSLGYGRITEGARRKMILHISKLGERAAILKKKDEEVTSGESLVLKAAIDELKNIVNTPIRTLSFPYVDENIPALFCSVLNKVCTYTLTSCNSNAQAILCEQLIPLLDTMLEKSAFTKQQNRIMEWKSQITQLNLRVQSKHFLHTPQRPKIHRNSLTLSPPLNVEMLQLPKKHSLQDHIPLIAQQQPPSAPLLLAPLSTSHQLTLIPSTSHQSTLIPSTSHQSTSLLPSLLPSTSFSSASRPCQGDRVDKQLESLAIKVAEKPLSPE